MLAEGVAFIALRRVSLYPAQVPTLRDSPAHRRDSDPLFRLRCGDVARGDRSFLRFAPEVPIPDRTVEIERAADQDVFPIVDRPGVGSIVGVLDEHDISTIALDAPE